MKVLINKEISIEKWNKLLTLSLYTSPFQLPSFYNLFNAVSGLSADVFAVEERSEIKALCVVTLQKESGIKGFFSRRAIIYGGPVLYEAKEKEVELLISSIEKNLKRKVIYIEIRNLHDYNVYYEIFKRNNWRYLSYQNFIINCTDKDFLYNSMSNNRKRQIKKAISNGVKIKEAENLNEIKEYYTILHGLYSKKIKKPLFPYYFFKTFFESDLGVFLLVFFNDKVIGGIMCPVMPQKAIYEFYICGLDAEYKDQYPSVMATWAAIEYGLQNNIPLFDLMGAGSPEEYYGVREFKARFGGELVENGRFLRVLNPILFNFGRLCLRVLSRIKG